MANHAIERRDAAAPSRVELIAEARDDQHPAGRMLISSPREIDDLVRRVPEGRVLTVGAMRAALARNHRADYTCPTTTSDFLVLAAAAADEERAAGGRGGPYWRVVDDDGGLTGYGRGGIAAQSRELDREGVAVLYLGGRPRVTTVDHFAWTPPPLGRKAR